MCYLLENFTLIIHKDILNYKKSGKIMRIEIECILLVVIYCHF